MQSLILVLHVLVAIAIVALVLLQHGRGADVGASFGSGASNTMFGSAGSLPFLVKVTAVCAGVFFLTSISLSYLAVHRAHVQTENLLNIPVTAKPSSAVPAPATTAGKTTNTNNDAAAAISFAPTVDNNKK